MQKKALNESTTNLYDGADFKGQVGVLVLLPDLEARQMREPKLHLVLVQEVLGHGALDGLSVFQLKEV